MSIYLDNLAAEAALRIERPAWFSNTQSDLLDAIAELKAKLPGWYYSVCECQVSCDARIAPTTDSPDVLITSVLLAGSKFDEGFDVALEQPSTLADALRHVIAEAIEAKVEHFAAQTREALNLGKPDEGGLTPQMRELMERKG